PAPLDATDKRGHTVSVRLNEAELARLDSQRDAVQMQPRKLGLVEAHRNGMPALVRGVERRRPTAAALGFVSV
ncbi:hypothetical protein, partial [Aeromonas caviae]|uniref:hypothetical protein n=1 Tax=Aeromonas caviae TaxID=648 RepID=UPI001CC7C3F0